MGPKLQAFAVGFGAAFVTAMTVAINAKCPGLVDSLPQILSSAAIAGALAGLAKWSHSGRSQP